MYSCTSSPKCVAALLLRISFGLSLFFVGLTHYMDFGGFQLLVTDSLGPLVFLGTIWSYILPALFILGGALFVVGRYSSIATWLAGVGLASIPAGMLVKPVLSGVGLDETMPPAINAFIWLLVFMWVVKTCAYCESCHACGTCDCSPMEKKDVSKSTMASPSVMKAAPKAKKK